MRGEIHRAGILRLRWWAWRGSKGLALEDRIPLLVPLPWLVAKRNERLNARMLVSKEALDQIDENLLALEAMLYLEAVARDEDNEH